VITVFISVTLNFGYYLFLAGEMLQRFWWKFLEKVIMLLLKNPGMWSQSRRIVLWCFLVISSFFEFPESSGGSTGQFKATAPHKYLWCTVEWRLFYINAPLFRAYRRRNRYKIALTVAQQSFWHKFLCKQFSWENLDIVDRFIFCSFCCVVGSKF